MWAELQLELRCLVWDHQRKPHRFLGGPPSPMRRDFRPMPSLRSPTNAPPPLVGLQSSTRRDRPYRHPRNQRNHYRRTPQNAPHLQTIFCQFTPSSSLHGILRCAGISRPPTSQHAIPIVRDGVQDRGLSFRRRTSTWSSNVRSSHHNL